MRRTPAETVVALVVVGVTLAAGLFVVLHDTVEDDALLATRSEVVAEPTTTTSPAPTTSTTVPSRRTDATSSPDDPQPDPQPTTTTVPVSSPSSPSTTTPEPEEVEPACSDLQSETSWLETGDQATLETGAGTSAVYVEVVTNQGDEPCALSTNRCGSTARLRTADGSPTDSPSQACTAVHTEAVLAPGDERREELEVRFPVPPGDYEAVVRRYDGTEAVLPVRLDDRVPNCPAHRLSLRDPGEQFRDRDHVSDQGFSVDLVVEGADETCSVRVVESRLLLVSAQQRASLVDRTERWSVPPAGEAVHTHVVAPPTELAPADYDATVTLLLDDGGQLTAPFRLVIG